MKLENGQVINRMYVDSHIPDGGGDAGKLAFHIDSDAVLVSELFFQLPDFFLVIIRIGSFGGRDGCRKVLIFFVDSIAL